MFSCHAITIVDNWTGQSSLYLLSAPFCEGMNMADFCGTDDLLGWIFLVNVGRYFWKVVHVKLQICIASKEAPTRTRVTVQSAIMVLSKTTTFITLVQQKFPVSYFPVSPIFDQSLSYCWIMNIYSSWSLQSRRIRKIWKIHLYTNTSIFGVWWWPELKKWLCILF